MRLFEIDCDTEIRAVEFFIDRALARYRFHKSNGEIGELQNDVVMHNPLIHLDRAKALIVALEAPSLPGETWADVSLLHSPSSRPFNENEFDFDWLFSAEQKEPSPATRNSAAVLSERTEAQARLISASPPIVVS